MHYILNIMRYYLPLRGLPACRADNGPLCLKYGACRGGERTPALSESERYKVRILLYGGRSCNVSPRTAREKQKKRNEERSAPHPHHRVVLHFKTRFKVQNVDKWLNVSLFLLGNFLKSGRVRWLFKEITKNENKREYVCATAWPKALGALL